MTITTKEAIDIVCEADNLPGQIITRSLHRIKAIRLLYLWSRLFCAKQLQGKKKSNAQQQARRKPAKPDRFTLKGRHFGQILHNIVAYAEFDMTPERKQMAADSSGRCNTCVKSFCRCFEIQGFSGSLIQSTSHSIE